MQQCNSSKLNIRSEKIKPPWVSKKLSTAAKLSIIDNVAGVKTSAERELFHQLDQECRHKRTANWTCMLSKYDAAASASYRKGVCDIHRPTIPLLQDSEQDCVNVSSIAKSR